jgi:hypothetical protein
VDPTAVPAPQYDYMAPKPAATPAPKVVRSVLLASGAAVLLATGLFLLWVATTRNDVPQGFMGLIWVSFAMGALGGIPQLRKHVDSAFWGKVLLLACGIFLATRFVIPWIGQPTGSAPPRSRPNASGRRCDRTSGSPPGVVQQAVPWPQEGLARA